MPQYLFEVTFNATHKDTESLQTLISALRDSLEFLQCYNIRISIDGAQNEPRRDNDA